MRICHIGYLVKKLDRAVETFCELGYKIADPVVHDEYRKVDICFAEKDGYIVELVSPCGEDSVVFELIKKYRNTPYHFCYLSDDFDNELSKMCKNGYTLIDYPCPAPALQGKRAAFIMSPVIGMIEILEE